MHTTLSILNINPNMVNFTFAALRIVASGVVPVRFSSLWLEWERIAPLRDMLAA